MKYFLAFFTIIILLPSCQQQVEPELQQELSQARIRLQVLEAELQSTKAKGQLEHIVFLKAREGLTDEETAALFSFIRKLGGIDGVNNLEAGRVADTGDERFISDHNFAFRMDFASMADYEAYIEHPTHQAIRESLKPYLAGPPAVYDLWIE